MFSTNKSKSIFHILIFVATLLYGNISANRISNATESILQKLEEDGGYFLRLPKIDLKHSHWVSELDEKLKSGERRELASILGNLNSKTLIDTLIPILKPEEKDRQVYFAKEQNLKNFETCTEDINTFLQAAQETLTWAVRMVDAAGKPGPGILRENIRFLGDFDECVNTETDQRFDPRYCLATIAILKIGQFKFSEPFGVQLGLCVPDSCDGEVLGTVLDQYFQTTFGNGSIYVVKNECQEKDLPLTDKAKASIIVLSIIAALMVIGTLYDILYVKELWTSLRCGDEDLDTLYSSRDHGKTHRSEYEPLVNAKEDPTPTLGIFGRLLLAFSVYNNTSKLFSTSSASGNIDCINGIRFVSMTWVVLGHSIIFGMPVMDNVHPYLDMSYGRWTFQVISNALVAVDTFFALSGLLLVYLVMKQLQKTGPSAGFFAHMYFHRFWRLTPPYMLVMLAYIPLFKYLSDGPVWPQNGIEVDECKDTWWTNLLYINNFVNLDKMCMGWSWYLANDMQFFIISPIIIMPLFYLGTIGLVVPFVFLIGNAMASGIITYENDLPPNLELFGGGGNDYFKMYYVRPYTRIGPYIIGMMTGYFLYKYDCKARIPKVFVILGWMFAAAVALAVQYGLFEHTNGHPVTEEVAALYNALHRMSWALAICWVIFACANGYGGFVNTLMSWKGLVPLSRLTYCVYLVHPVVMDFHYYSQRRMIYLDNNNLVFSFLGLLVMSYLVGFLASMAFEAPMIGIERAFKKQRS